MGEIGWPSVRGGSVVELEGSAPMGGIGWMPVRGGSVLQFDDSARMGGIGTPWQLRRWLRQQLRHQANTTGATPCGRSYELSADPRSASHWL